MTCRSSRRSRARPCRRCSGSASGQRKVQRLWPASWGLLNCISTGRTLAASTGGAGLKPAPCPAKASSGGLACVGTRPTSSLSCDGDVVYCVVVTYSSMPGSRLAAACPHESVVVLSGPSHEWRLRSPAHSFASALPDPEPAARSLHRLSFCPNKHCLTRGDTRREGWLGREATAQSRSFPKLGETCGLGKGEGRPRWLASLLLSLSLHTHALATINTTRLRDVSPFRPAPLNLLHSRRLLLHRQHRPLQPSHHGARPRGPTTQPRRPHTSQPQPRPSSVPLAMGY